MEIDPVIFWNVVLTLIIAPAVWAFRNMMAELKDEMQHLMDALHRVEDKLDRVLSRDIK